MADTENKEIARKDSLLSPTNGEIREHMVNTAVNFLQNPKVKSSPLSHKRAFLKKKGLTENEIDAAFKSALRDTQDNLVPYHMSALVPRNYEVKPLPKPSIWAAVHSYGSTVIIVGVALYGLHQFYKLYIEPWLFGETKKEDRMLQFQKQLMELNQSLSQLKQSVAFVQETLNYQQEKLHKTITENHREIDDSMNLKFLTDLKADLATVKSLLLNRHQFADVPKVTPTIPEWQLIGASPSEKLTAATRKNQGRSNKNEQTEGCEQKSSDTNSSKSDEEAAENDQQLSGDSIEALEAQEEHVSLSASSDSFENYPPVP